MSVEEYLELDEHNPDTRYEYLDGYAYMMSGGSIDHATISFNIQTILNNALRKGSCRAHNSDVRVRISENRYVHPDVTVTCDPGDRGRVNLIKSPRVVVEVLSPSTEVSDRVRKLQAYLACPTIQEYFLVDSRSMRIEVYCRKESKWVYEAFGAGDMVEVESLHVSFPIEDAYVDVALEEV